MKKNDRKTLNIARIGIGIALYVVLSMTLKIPIVGHIGLDLGYVVLAVYAYLLGCIPAMIVGVWTAYALEQNGAAERLHLKK